MDVRKMRCYDFWLKQAGGGGDINSIITSLFQNTEKTTNVVKRGGKYLK